MDLENLIALQALVYGLHRIGDDEQSASARSTEIQRLGEEIEQRARTLITEVRQVRGLGEAPAPRIAVEINGNGNGHQPPPMPEVNGKLNGAHVRDAMIRFKDGFMVKELAVALDCPIKDVKKFVDIWATSGMVRPTGFKLGRDIQYEYVKPEGPTPARPTQRPPEQEPPAGLERRATGMPVRVSPMQKATRLQRSQAGRRHRMVMQDRRYEEMMSARDKRANEQRFKALRDAAAGKKGGKTSIKETREANARAMAMAKIPKRKKKN